MASRNPNDLCPELREKMAEFVDICHRRGITVMVYCTYRSGEEQDADFAKGASKARAGQFPHNCVDADGNPSSKAFDACPLDILGKPNWDSTSEAYALMAMVGKEMGLVWGGDFKHLHDAVHFELPNWKE